MRITEQLVVLVLFYWYAKAKELYSFQECDFNKDSGEIRLKKSNVWQLLTRKDPEIGGWHNRCNPELGI